MTSPLFTIEKESARAAVERLLRAIESIPQIKPMAVTVSTSASSVHYQKSLGDRPIEQVLFTDELFIKTLDWLESGPHARLFNVQVQCHYTQLNSYHQQQNCQIILVRGAPYDQLTFNHDDSAAYAWPNAAVLDGLRSAYALPERDAPSEKTTGEPPHIEQLVYPVLRRFAESAAELHHVIGQGTKQLAAQFQENDRVLREKLDAERQRIHQEEESVRASLNEEREHLRQEEEKRSASLRGEREKFEAERREYNDKKSTLVRRDLLEKMQKRLEEHGKTFTLSADTSKKTKPVQWACLGLASIALAGACVSAWYLFHDAEFKWHHLLPFTSSVLILVSTAVFYIRWSNNLFVRHADLETKNQLLHYDMLRASWFAEMLFEYKDEKHQPLPESVIQVMTKNLFSDLAGAEPARHPADDVAAFIKRLNRVKVGESEVEMEADGKSKGSS